MKIRRVTEMNGLILEDGFIKAIDDFDNVVISQGSLHAFHKIGDMVLCVRAGMLPHSGANDGSVSVMSIQKAEQEWLELTGDERSEILNDGLGWITGLGSTESIEDEEEACEFDHEEGSHDWYCYTHNHTYTGSKWITPGRCWDDEPEWHIDGLAALLDEETEPEGLLYMILGRAPGHLEDQSWSPYAGAAAVNRALKQFHIHGYTHLKVLTL